MTLDKAQALVDRVVLSLADGTNLTPIKNAFAAAMPEYDWSIEIEHGLCTGIKASGRVETSEAVTAETVAVHIARISCTEVNKWP